MLQTRRNHLWGGWWWGGGNHFSPVGKEGAHFPETLDSHRRHEVEGWYLSATSLKPPIADVYQ